MAKSSGLGDNYLFAGYNLSGDTNALGTIEGGHDPLDVTGIDKDALERIYGLRRGLIEFSTFWNSASGQSHDVLETLPRTDVHAMYLRGTGVGNHAACMVAKQVDYNVTRATDGSLTAAVQALSTEGVPLEWGEQLTAGLRTDTGAANGTSLDNAAATALGAQAYLQVTAFSGTDATISVQSSSDNGAGDAFANVSGLVSASITAAPYFERLDTGASDSIERYLRASVATSGGFTSITWCIVVVRNLAARAFA